MSYSSVGRKTITFNGTAFTDFVDIFSNQSFSNTITHSPAQIVAGCANIFTTSITGSMYYWYFGPGALTPVDSGPNLQSDTAFFGLAGATMVTVVVNTPCCGLVKDSLPVNVQSNVLNISLVAAPDTICEGTQLTLIATPTGYATYSFFIDNTLANVPSAANTFNTSALAPGDSVNVVGYNGVCYTSPSATVHPVVYPIPAAAGMISSVPSDTICSGDTVTFTASPPGLGLYYFYVGGSLQQSSANNIWTTDQLYNGNVVYVKVQQNGCLGVPSVLDTFVVHPTPFVTLLPANPTICQGSTVVFSATSSVGGSTFDFYVNAIDSQSSLLNTYTTNTLNNGDVVYVTATALGCLSKPSNSVPVIVNPIPVVTLTTSAAPSDSICQGTPISFTATPATDSNYIFYNINSIVQDSSLANYATSNLPMINSIYVEAQNKGCNGYSDTISITVIPAPIVTVGPAQLNSLRDAAS